MHLYGDLAYMRVRDHTCLRGSETERDHGCIRHPELGLRRGAVGALRVTAG